MALGTQDRDAVLALPCEVIMAAREHHLVREGGQPQNACLLISGFAFRYQLVADGSRSISAIHMDGDMVNLENSLLRIADHGVKTLTSCTVALIPCDAVREVARAFPNVGMAMWYSTLVDGSIFREWIANNSRRSALERIAHLLCEIGVRLEAASLGKKSNYELPLTQDQLADCTGLTPVHVNRMLRALHNDGAIARSKRLITIADWDKLRLVADFRSAYLHLPV